MNKKELIEKYTNYNLGGFSRKALLIHFLRDLEQLDEPEKVKVPQFVADWIEEVKPAYTLFAAMEYGNLKIDKWLDNNSNQEKFAQAWIFGYEVEKEKIYTVKVKAVLGQYLGRYYLNNEELTPQFIRTQCTGKEKPPTFTRKELEEAGFDWVFDCEGIEIEEVE